MTILNCKYDFVNLTVKKPITIRITIQVISGVIVLCPINSFINSGYIFVVGTFLFSVALQFWALFSNQWIEIVILSSNESSLGN